MDGDKVHEILANMGEEYELVEQVWSEENKPVFKVRNHTSQYILKCQEESPRHLKRFVTKALGTTGAKNERLMYQWFESQNFRYFRHPGLVAVSNNDLLIEYIPGSGKKDSDSRLIESLHEFYKRSEEIEFNRMHVLVHGIRYSPALNIIRALPAVRRAAGFRTVLSTLKTVGWCYKNQPVLEKSFYIHNDLSSNNVIQGPKQSHPVIIDFQSAKKEYRWILNDIVRYAFYGDERIINVETINNFIKKIDPTHFGENIRIDAQIRYALIVRTIQSILYKPKGSILRFYIDILLDDEAFKKWVDSRGIIRVN